MIGYVYSKSLGRSVPIDWNDKTEDEHKRMARALRMREKEETEQYYKEHRNGYCPRCHMLIPMGKTKCECMED